MKRMVVFILIIFLLCGLNLSIFKNFDIINLFADASVEVYLDNFEIPNEFEFVKNGDGIILLTNIDGLYYILNKYKINGFTLKTDKTVDDVLALIGAKNVFQGKFGIYGYSNYVKNLVNPINFNDSLINFQISSSDSGLLLGFPLLLGAY